ncbi:MAG: phosphatidate cytidylyltransferase [Deltaproteobacteria bacterium]|nr:phosphatidate cytidylyltransferase [Deltaproteobacteria bacterium]
MTEAQEQSAPEQSSKKPSSGELSRWLVALILLPPTIFSIFFPNKTVLLIWTAAIGTMAWREYCLNLLGRERLGLFALACLGLYATLAGTAYFGPDGQTFGLATALALGAAYFIHILNPEQDRISVNVVSRYALGHLYLTFFLSFIMHIKDLDHGSSWLLFVILITSLNDTGAFYFGSRLKGPKLAPKVSPKKTISGLLGGCLVASVAAGFSRYYLPVSFTWKELAALGLFLGMWGTFGDLFESAFKRAMGVKDTSNILRGHGGFWDRLDSMLFNLPPVYFYVTWQTMPS